MKFSMTRLSVSIAVVLLLAVFGFSSSRSASVHAGSVVVFFTADDGIHGREPFVVRGVEQ